MATINAIIDELREQLRTDSDATVESAVYILSDGGRLEISNEEPGNSKTAVRLEQVIKQLSVVPSRQKILNARVAEIAVRRTRSV